MLMHMPDSLILFHSAATYSILIWHRGGLACPRLWQRASVRPSRRVLHLLRGRDRPASRTEAVVAYYACFCTGAVAVPLNTRFKTDALHPLLQRLRPVLYLGDDQFRSQVASIEPDILILSADARFMAEAAAGDSKVWPWRELYADASNREPALAGVGRDAPLVLYPTSGTTGLSKLTIHTAATLFATGASFIHLGLDGQQTVLHALHVRRRPYDPGGRAGSAGDAACGRPQGRAWPGSAGGGGARRGPLRGSEAGRSDCCFRYCQERGRGHGGDLSEGAGKRGRAGEARLCCHSGYHPAPTKLFHVPNDPRALPPRFQGHPVSRGNSRATVRTEVAARDASSRKSMT